MKEGKKSMQKIQPARVMETTKQKTKTVNRISVSYGVEENHSRFKHCVLYHGLHSLVSTSNLVPGGHKNVSFLPLKWHK